jgi:hypothetical protein
MYSMAARVINAQHATVIGTVEQIAEVLRLLRGAGAGIVNMDRATLVVLDKPLTEANLQTAIETTPNRT